MFFRHLLHLIMCVILVYCREFNICLLVPHSGPRAFGIAVEITVGMAIEKVSSCRNVSPRLCLTLCISVNRKCDTKIVYMVIYIYRYV